MKRIFIAALAAIAVFSAKAEGYQVNTFSARQIGMGQTGVALDLGAESQIFNPGALAFSDNLVNVSGSFTAIKSTATCDFGGTRYETSNKVSTPMNVAAAFRIYDGLHAGVVFYTPYGSSIDWGKSWPGAVLNQSVDLKVFTLQPTVSWRPLKNLSVGAGLMISWGSVNLNKALVSSSSMDKLIDLMNFSATAQGMGAPYTKYGDVPPASVNLTGKAQLALGYNIGVMWKPTDRLSLGLSFRSKMEMQVSKGDAQVTYANEQARVVLGEKLDNINYANFEASMPCPYILTFGAAYKFTPKLTVAFDAQFNGWKAYRKLDIEFAEAPVFNQNLPKNYSNAWTWHLGAEYNLTKRFDVRAGLMIDCSPCNKDFYNPETPGMTKIEPSVGFTFRPVPRFGIDLAFMYVAGCGQTGTGEYADFLAPVYNASLDKAHLPESAFPRLQATGSFTGKYDTHALIPAIALSYTF